MIFPWYFQQLIESIRYCGSLKKLQYYRIKEKNLFWFEIHITGREQYINFEINGNNGKTEPLEIIQIRSILGSLLFIIYINNLCQVSDILKLIVFPDNTNLICSSNDINTIFFKYKFRTYENFSRQNRSYIFSQDSGKR